MSHSRWMQFNLYTTSPFFLCFCLCEAVAGQVCPLPELFRTLSDGITKSNRSPHPSSTSSSSSSTLSKYLNIGGGSDRFTGSRRSIRLMTIGACVCARALVIGGVSHRAMSNVSGGRQKVSALALLPQVHPIAFKARRKTQDREVRALAKRNQKQRGWGGRGGIKTNNPETDIHTLKAMS